MNKSKKSMNKSKEVDAVGEYFQLYMDNIWRIVECNGGALDILCYMTLSRGAGANIETAWSVTAIGQYLKVGRKAAEKSCELLTNIGVISPATHFEGSAQGRFPSKWKITQNGESIFLPNSLISQDKDIGPLGKLYHSVGKQSSMFEASRSKMLQLMILLCFYENYDLEDHGGVSPDIWTREWPMRDEHAQFSIPDGGYLAFIESSEPRYQERLISWLNRSGALPTQNIEMYIENAMLNLREKELINETLYVWNGNPFYSGTVHYTLCHLTYWKRDLQKVYLAGDVSDYCKEVLPAVDLARFKCGEGIYDVTGRKFVMIGFDGFQPRSAINLKYEPQTFDHKICRDSIFHRTLEFRKSIEDMRAIARGEIVHDGNYF